jgi:uncharacterized lipoprotein YehR (DUF1307 family)
MHLEIDISSNKLCADIELTVTHNDQVLLKTTADATIKTISFDIDEDPKAHEILLTMQGKNQTHTVVDEHGQIVEDVQFKITRIEIDQLDVKDLFCLGKECYTHSFNSTQPEFLDEFYGEMGCNGSVSLKFDTPIYLWLVDKFD